MFPPHLLSKCTSSFSIDRACCHRLYFLFSKVFSVEKKFFLVYNVLSDFILKFDIYRKEH
jgi:hypothetical protein